jgi:transcriptional regulator with XRE-family HTH domain
MNVQRIMDIITSNKLSKIDIASKMKVSRTTLDNLLNGADVKISTIESLADVLGVSVSEFFDAEPKPQVIKDTSCVENLTKMEREIIELRAENKVLRELQGLSARSQVHVG